MTKKILYLLLVVLIGSSIFLIGYIISNPQKHNPLSKSGANISRFLKPKETLAPHSLLEELPSEKVSYPKLSLDGRSITYYDATAGYLHKIELSETGNKNLTLQKIRPYLQNLNWSWNDKLLLAYDGADHLVYDLESNSSKILNRSIKNPAFSTIEDRAGYIWQDSAQSAPQISVSNTDFEFFKKLLPVSDNSWKVGWSGKNALTLQYSTDKTSSLFILDTENKHLSKLVSDKENLFAAWSVDGNSLLYSYGSSDKTLLYYRDIPSGGWHLLPKTTLASKCVWSIDNETVYCAVDNGSNDEFFSWKIGEKNVKSLKSDASIKTKAEDLFLSADENHIFFRNSFDGSLYRLRIEAAQ